MHLLGYGLANEQAYFRIWVHYSSMPMASFRLILLLVITICLSLIVLARGKEIDGRQYIEKCWEAKICKILSSNISPPNLSQLNLIRRMKISKFQHKGIPQSSVFHQTEGIFSSLSNFPNILSDNSIWSIFNFVISQIILIFAACETKVLETSGFASCSVCHFLPPVRRSQNFPKLSVATNAQNGRPGNTVVATLSLRLGCIYRISINPKFLGLLKLRSTNTLSEYVSQPGN